MNLDALSLEILCLFVARLLSDWSELFEQRVGLSAWSYGLHPPNFLILATTFLQSRIQKVLFR